MWDYPGTPPPSVYQVTHGTALQAAERYVSHHVLRRTALQAAVPYRAYPGTPPPSVYQVTQSTALQAAERYVKQRVS